VGGGKSAGKIRRKAWKWLKKPKTIGFRQFFCIVGNAVVAPQQLRGYPVDNTRNLLLKCA
jgi:hypothetical protein